MASQQQQDNNTPWMLTFADLLSLMLTFFVLLFSMSSVDFAKWEDVLVSLSDEFSETNAFESEDAAAGNNGMRIPEWSGQNLVYLQSLLERGITEKKIFKGVQVNTVGDRLYISVPTDIIFTPKTIQLAPKAQEVIEQITGLLINLQNTVMITAHANHTVIKNGKFLSNWELTMTQARIIAGLIQAQGLRQSITVLGASDTDFRNLRNDIPMQARYGLAARIDIIIMDEKRNKSVYDIL